MCYYFYEEIVSHLFVMVYPGNVVANNAQRRTIVQDGF